MVQALARVMGTGTPGFPISVPLASPPPSFWKWPLFLLYKCKCRQQLCSKCSFVLFQFAPVNVCGVPDVYRAAGGGVREENTCSLPHAACAPEGVTRQKTVCTGEEGPGALDTKERRDHSRPPLSQVHPERLR